MGGKLVQASHSDKESTHTSESNIVIVKVIVVVIVIVIVMVITTLGQIVIVDAIEIR